MQFLIYGILLLYVGLSASKTAFLLHNEEYEKCVQSHNFPQLSNSDWPKILKIISNISDIKCLDLQGSNIEYVTHSTLKNLPNLWYLNLAGNNIQKRNMDFVSKLQNLKVLVLDKAFRMPDENEDEFIFNVESSILESLYLRYNGIKKLVVSHNIQLNNLTKLVLSDNNLRKININENGLLTKANFEWLPQSLKYLHIENNKLQELILINMTELMEVQARNNEFETLKLENLPNLQSLLINEESLNLISIKNLSKLEDLILGFNKLDRILISDMNGLTALQNLQLEGRNVSFFDGQIVDEMPSLRSLFIGGSLLSTVPKIKNGSNLHYMFLPKNKIEELRAKDFWAMPNLEELNLSDNLIMELEPMTFSDLKKLRILNLEKNLLTTVSYLAFNSLCNLQKLRLSQNSIKLFDGEIVDSNPSLGELYLRNNLLEKIPVIISANNLWLLDIGGNKFQVLEKEDFGISFPNLQKLDLSFNNLTRIESEVFDNLNTLRSLHLHSNQLHTLPNDWSASLKNLEIVTLEKNKFNDYEALSLNESNLENTALSYSLENDYFLYCTLRNGINTNCNLISEYIEEDKTFFFKKKYMTFKKVANDKLKLIPSAEM